MGDCMGNNQNFKPCCSPIFIESMQRVLSNVLAIIGMMKKEYAHQVVVPPMECGEFDQEVEIFYS
jgi:hypothetical protein